MLHRLLHPSLILAILVYAPAFWSMLYASIALVARQYRGWHEWYCGLPLIQYPSLWLVVMGSKRLRKKHCRYMRYENRLWLSPNVRGFNLAKNEEGDGPLDMTL